MSVPTVAAPESLDDLKRLFESGGRVEFRARNGLGDWSDWKLATNPQWHTNGDTEYRRQEAPAYPEHEKMSAVKDASQAIGEFLLWLQHEKGWVVAVPHRHTDECYTQGLTQEQFEKEYGPRGRNIAGRDEWGRGRFDHPHCHLGEGQLLRASFSIEKLLAEHFDIDQQAIDAEKSAMLDALRQSSAPR